MKSIREKGLTILLVEGNEAEALPLQKMLNTRLGNFVHSHHVKHLSEAISFLSANDSDLILFGMKQSHHHNLTEITSLQTAFPNLPIIVLTDADDHISGQRAVENGALDHLVKQTLNAEILEQAIRYAGEKQKLLNRLEEALDTASTSDALLKQVLSLVPDGVVIVDAHGIIRFANTASAALFHVDPKYLVESPLGFPVPAEGIGEVPIQRAGQSILLETRATKLQWEKQKASLIFLRDITEQKHLKENLVYLSHHDPLTGLSNRSAWINHLEKAIANVSPSNGLIAVLVLDIHRLGQINDTLGYTIGDFLLKEIAKRLTVFTQQSNDAARVGGDEFAIFISHTAHVEAVSDTAQKILARLCEPYAIESDEWGIAVSIGIALYPSDARDPETLLEYAQMALQHVRKNGKNNYHYYSPTLEGKAKERLAVENNLRLALNQQDLFLVYQPIVSLATGQIVGMEALLRLRDEEMRTLLPGQFIPIAEETGVIVRIGMWALLNACTQNKEWQEMGLPPLTMAVNLSAVQLKETNFISMLTRILHRTRLSPQYLELELTESMMQDTESALRVLHALRAISVLSSIDDFGTGYSSLSHLRQFPFTTLKIDISFVRNIVQHEEDRSLVSTIITMAHNFRLRTIAEGVESLEQLQVLQSLGCDEVQGFFMSKPLSAEEATKMLSKPPRFF